MREVVTGRVVVEQLAVQLRPTARAHLVWRRHLGKLDFDCIQLQSCELDQVVDDPAVLRDIWISVMVPPADVSQVYTAPDRSPLAYEADGDRLAFVFEEVKGYRLAVIEQDS